jgi:transposase InsO family protein
MTIKMEDSHIVSIGQLREFAKLDLSLKLKPTSKKEMYRWINEVLNRFRYLKLKKKEKGLVRGYIQKMTKLSNAQLSRVIKIKKGKGIVVLSPKKRNSFSRKYTSSDLSLLIKTDNAHKRLSGPATVEILRRECMIFGKTDYSNIQNISSSHLYNLRETRQYQTHATTFTKTSGNNKVTIGERRKPNPYGKPGFLRVDSVHQGDLDKEKGVYHINMTDEVTQWEIVGTVERISEYYLAPLLEDSINQYPFKIVNFHSDNGSEYINKIVVKLLNKMMISQTKSRPRKSNDNALAESKNGSIVRKNMGYVHIPRQFAPMINDFCKKYLNIYINYHRPCGFATIKVDKRGKEKKVYDTYLTPYEKFKTIPDCDQYLKEGVCLEILDRIAYSKSDNDFALEMQKAREELFKNFKHVPQEMLSFTTFVSCSLLD